MANIVSAVFDDHDDAQKAVDWLHHRGVSDDAISVARRGEEDVNASPGMASETGYKGGASTLERPAESSTFESDTYVAGAGSYPSSAYPADAGYGPETDEETRRNYTPDLNANVSAAESSSSYGSAMREDVGRGVHEGGSLRSRADRDLEYSESDMMPPAQPNQDASVSTPRTDMDLGRGVRPADMDRDLDRDVDRDAGHRPAMDAEAKQDAKEMGQGALAGLGVGAGVGALFGLAAALIPGIGPFITAGALATALGSTAGGVVAGAIVGGVSGGLAGALAHWGLNEAESKYYAGEVEKGATYVGVDLDRANLRREEVESAFSRFNGRLYNTSAR